MTSFQPTLPARGATSKTLTADDVLSISTHAPRTGSDFTAFFMLDIEALFQPTLPARGATDWIVTVQPLAVISTHAPRTGSDNFESVLFVQIYISTHAPRTGSDKTVCVDAWAVTDFNPRSPHGERQRKVTILSIRIIGFAQKVYHKTVLLRISLAENAVILPEKP